MFEIFEKYISQKVEISSEELKIVQEASSIRKLRKGQSILHEGEVWAITCFIASGCFRLYRYDKEGTDHTARFGIQNWWISDQESYNHQKPSEYNIEALAASTVIVWPKQAWDNLLVTIPAMRKFNEELLARGYEASQRRIFSLISHTASEKYLDFQQTYPGVFNSVPLHMVASYLGISRETLSRIRANL
ncbi:Crp/Fnr family transcriptional regulator [Flavobacterium zepuense]|uniref:Crp/Fnr family transcriptional regulator n=1 Tax=Flavobacterium zepuense TaxID=2593302 RepID=A0A552UWK2_9FLAO|nr:Crp/Fnr family transcriptional regulator [Flavobacterium zepuense]TRW22530.1 Crp/Fnr family transcriptional regulator [Flavobacterium zepuense]